jgi:chemotaxis protein CheY-P-specific phosphatase CheC
MTGRVGPLAEAEFVDALGGTASHAVGIWFTVTGTSVTRFALLMRESDALALAGRLLRADVSSLDGRAQAALSELGNIAASAFLNGVAAAAPQTARSSVLPSVPKLEHGSACDVMARCMEQRGAWQAVADVDQRQVYLLWHPRA